MNEMIAQLRKEKNMTQKELADMLGVTDKAVSKWERGKSYPDISLVPGLAKILGVSTDALFQNEGAKEGVEKSTMMKKIRKQINLVLKAVALALGVAIIVLNAMGAVEVESVITMVGIGLFCLAVAALQGTDEK